jgi:DNA-binding Xre family transcriptional regulator
MPPVAAHSVPDSMALNHTRLRQLMDAQGITGYRLAKTAGLSTNTIYGLLGDATRPMSWLVIDKLCLALDCQPGDFLTHSAEGV